MDLARYGTLNVLTALVWGEAEGEDFIGKVAVAQVVRNRAEDYRWPNTFIDVALQEEQFSCFNEGNKRRPEILHALECGMNFSNLIWRECRAAAQLVIGKWIRDPTGGANHYHAEEAHPYWAEGQTPCWTHGKHLFYRL